MLEGRLQAIRLEGVPDRTLNITFTGLEGNILNLRDIEQGIEQLNRGHQTPVAIEILPRDRQGYSVVNLTAMPEFPLSDSVIFDYSGRKSTGSGQLSCALYGNNLFDLADKRFVTGGRSNDFSDSHDAQSFVADVSIPYGHGLLDYSYSWNNYLSTIDNSGYRWLSSDDAETHRLKGSWGLFRNGSTFV